MQTEEAMTADEIIKRQIGELVAQVAILQAENMALKAKLEKPEPIPPAAKELAGDNLHN
jgi:regulator of replication initiation timing